MAESQRRYPMECNLPLRVADGNVAGIKMYVCGTESIPEKRKCQNSINIFIAITLSVVVTAMIVVAWYFASSGSSGWEDTLETIDADSVISGLSRNDYEGEEMNAMLYREQHNVLLIISDDGGWADFGAFNSYDRFSSLATPKLDHFMNQGLLFKNFHTQPICTPARGSLFTGRWTWAIGMQVFASLSECTNGHLPQDIPTWAELLAERGYLNHFIGKWNLGCDSWLATPLGRGFDTFLGALNHPEGLNRAGGGEWSEISGTCDGDPLVVKSTDVFEKCLATCFSYSYALWSDWTMQCECYTEGCNWTQTTRGESQVSMFPGLLQVEEVSSTFRNQNLNESAKYKLYEWRSQSSKSIDWFDQTDGGDPQVGIDADDLMVTRAEKYMEQLAEQDSPWTMTVAFTTPHASLSWMPNGTMDTIYHDCLRFFNEHADTYNYNRGVICQQMANLDERFDSLLVKLKELDLYEDTLVIFVNDNGGDPGQIDFSANPNYGLNWPYRGGKFTFWEGGIRTVLALGGGALPKAYRKKKNLDMHDIVDVAATILAAGGFSNRDLDLKKINGVPLIDISVAEQAKQEIIYHSMPMFQSEEVYSNTSVITYRDIKFVGRNSYLSYLYGAWSTLPEVDSIGTKSVDGSECSEDGCLYDLDDDPYEMMDLSFEKSHLIESFISVVTGVIKDPAFNDGIIYSPENSLCGVESSYTYIQYGDRSYHYNYPWLDTSEVLVERRRLREKRRDLFRERKNRRRRKHIYGY